jgi:hypothetical protein
MNRKIDSSALFTGSLLIGVGSLFLLDRLDIIEFHFVVSRFWPLIIVFIGASRVMKGNAWGGSWLIAVGTWLQLVRLHAFGLTYSSSWPLLLIAMGAGMIVRALIETRRRHEA